MLYLKWRIGVNNSFSFLRKAGAACALVCVFFSLCSCSEKVPSVTTRLVTDGSNITDHSYNEKAWTGILDFYHDEWGEEKYFETRYDIVPCLSPGLRYSTLKQAAEAGVDLLVLVSFTLSPVLEIIAPGYPNQKFLMIDGSCGGFPNVLNITFATEEGSFLVGAAAALQAQADGINNPIFGFIGGVESDTITDFEVGYVQGIRTIFPNAEIYDFYVGDWSSPQIAAKKAKEWYDGKVYAVYSAAGASGNGTIAQAVAHRKSGKNVWAIGVDSDQINEGSYGVGKSAVLTSMLKNVDKAVIYGLSLVEKGTFISGSQNLGLKEHGVGYTVSNPEFKLEVQKKLEEYNVRIIAGDLRLISTRNDNGMVQKILDTVIHQQEAE